MAKSQGRKQTDPRARGQQKRRTKTSELSPDKEEVRRPPEGYLGKDFGQDTFERHSAILGDSRLSSQSNAAQRASLVLQLQRDYGNQYVQRLVHHVSQTRTDAVQRQNEEEELQMKPLRRQEEEELQMKPVEPIHTSVLQTMLIQRLPKPAVSDSKLSNLVNDLYHGANAKNKIGDGSTADAIRYEKKEGKPVGGRWHTQKGQEYLAALNKWMERNQDSADSDDIKAAQAMIDDLNDALK